MFSIIQKDRWHRSNLYGDAPMYFMQRITWSGVAMHQGVVPNHPASHGCIRLPESFARQLWGITKLGVRVVVTRGDVTPVAFAHPKLFIYKQPDPVEEEKPVEQVAAESSSTDLVRQAYRALETAQAFTKPDEIATDASKPGESAFTAMARAEKKPEPAPASATSADVVKTAYDAFDMGNYRRGKSAAKAATANPADKPADAVRPLKPGPIAVFVSRKEGKVFVRKGFEPVFDAPVTIEQSRAAARHPRVHGARLQRRQRQPALDRDDGAEQPVAADAVEEKRRAGAGGARQSGARTRPLRSSASPSRRTRSTASPG